MKQRDCKNTINRIPDILMLLCGFILVVCFFLQIKRYKWMIAAIILVLLSMIWAANDLIASFRKIRQPCLTESFQGYGLQQLILLDSQERPVKSWDLQGRTSLIIGKAGQGQELDIDLSDCEYSGFIDFQHAVLNFCLDQWYVEDMESQNGVKIKKVEDGECYRVIHRPCKVVAGDIIYIANTKLLLT